MKTEILELESLISKYQMAYYSGEPSVSDAEYDAICDRLRQLSPDSNVLQQIGKDDTIGAEVKHKCPMGSQNKAANEEEFNLWLARQKATSPLQFIVQHKLDGCSIELQYVHGLFDKAVTRGDGIIGADISANARKMHGFVPEILRWTGSIRGEVVMLFTDFDQYGNGKANPRNAAAGIMKRLDGKDCEHLTIIAYDTTNENLITEVEKVQWLVSNDFKTPEFSQIVDEGFCDTAPAIHQIREEIAKTRTTLPYLIDGLVVKQITIDRDDEKLPRPEHQIAYKFPCEEAATELTEITWEQSGAVFTPVGHFEPVQLGGTTVRKANLCNPELIEAMCLCLGCTVVVTKRGEIIPKIEKVLFTPANARPPIYPKICTTCGKPVSRVGCNIVCTNSACPALIEHQVAKWLETLGIKGIGPATIKDYVASGTVASIPDLYKKDFGFDRPDACSVSQTNIYTAIHSKKEISLAQYIAGFDIDGIGKSTVGTIVAAGYKSLERIMSATIEELEAIPGIGRITAEAILAGIDKNLADMLSLTASGAIIVLPEVEEGALLGKTVCFTGNLDTMSRSQAESLVRGAGGTAKSSIVKGLSFLVTNDTTSGSAKNVKAQALGVEIINEEQFIALCKGEIVS